MLGELVDRAATATPTRKVGAGILTFLILRALAHYNITPESLGPSPESEQALIAFAVMWLTREPSPVTVVDARPVAPRATVFDQDVELASVAPAGAVQSPAPPPSSPTDGGSAPQSPSPPPPIA